MPLTVEPERRFEPLISDEHLPTRLDGGSKNRKVARSMCTLEPMSKGLLEICRRVEWLNDICEMGLLVPQSWTSKGLLWEQGKGKMAIRARGNVKLTLFGDTI